MTVYQKKKTAGRPTKLTPDLLKEIKRCTLEGMNLKETAKACNLELEGLYVWHSDNFNGIADKILGWKRDRKLKLAEQNIDELLVLDPVNTGVTKKGDIFEFTDPRLLKIKADTSVFVSETLGNNTYNKKQSVDLNGQLNIKTIEDSIKKLAS